jgi:hypothetical protein
MLYMYVVCVCIYMSQPIPYSYRFPYAAHTARMYAHKTVRLHFRFLFGAPLTYKIVACARGPPRGVAVPRERVREIEKSGGRERGVSF